MLLQKSWILFAILPLFVLYCKDSSSEEQKSLETFLNLSFLSQISNQITGSSSSSASTDSSSGTTSGTSSGTSSGATSFENIATYYKTMTKLELEVFYEENAVPYASSFTVPNPQPGSSSTKEVWTIFEDNLIELFKKRSTSVTISIPKTISSMTSIPSQGKTAWTISDVTALAKKYRKNTSTSTTSYFVALFVNGYYSSDGSTTNTGVIGINVTNTPFIVIFKQVVDSTGNSTTISGRATRVYVEQSTLVHEMGHALGLVNNGVTMLDNHQDTSNGKHCTNTSCVMYYANSGTSALVTYIQTYIDTSGSTIMFKSECLNDTQSYKP